MTAPGPLVSPMPCPPPRARTAADLTADGGTVDQHDIDSLVLMWEERHPGQVTNPTGQGSLYRVAESYEGLLGGMRVAG